MTLGAGGRALSRKDFQIKYIQYFMTYGLCLSFLSAAGPWDSTPKTDLDQEDMQQVMFWE
jgi:hypothetical protein